MPSAIPTSISRPKPYLLHVEWGSSMQATITLEAFREECPCAVCKGETIMGTTYVFGIKQFSPGMNELKKLEPVGNYGLQAYWGDGHDSGIYTWETLLDIVRRRKLSDSEIAELSRRETPST